MGNWVDKNGLARFKEKLLVKVTNLIADSKGGVSSINGQTGDVTINVPPTPNAYVIEAWSNDTSWYIKYSNGWVEQGGEVSTTTGSNTVVTFPVPFSKPVYFDASGKSNTSEYWAIATVSESTVTNTGMNVSQRDRNANRLKGTLVWIAKGYY